MALPQRRGRRRRSSPSPGEHHPGPDSGDGATRRGDRRRDRWGSGPTSFNNTDMIDGYRRLGAELLEQLRGPPAIAACCGYVGTAGCFLGTTQALRAQLPTPRRVAVEPMESAVLS